MYQESEYNKAYRKRIIIFLIITGLYLLFSATYTVAGFFTTIPFSDNDFLYTYCLYSIWFNAYSYYRYHRNSVEEERKRDVRHMFYDVAGLPTYSYKKARRHICLLSSLAVVVNMALIFVTWAVW